MRRGEDEATLAFYEAEAPVYAAHGTQGASRHLPEFLDALTPGAKILELGCGGGRDSAAMLTAGFEVDATDGCAALARKAEARIGQPVHVMHFSELNAIARYDGVLASACLLHVPRADLEGIIARIHRALVPGGAFMATYKGGTAEGRDRFGRYFNYPDIDWLRTTYEYAAPWGNVVIESEPGGGYDGVVNEWHKVMATRKR